MKRSDVVSEKFFDLMNDLVRHSKDMGEAEYQIRYWTEQIKHPKVGVMPNPDHEGMLRIAEDKLHGAAARKSETWTALHALVGISSQMFDVDELR